MVQADGALQIRHPESSLYAKAGSTWTDQWWRGAVEGGAETISGAVDGKRIPLREGYVHTHCTPCRGINRLNLSSSAANEFMGIKLRETFRGWKRG